MPKYSRYQDYVISEGKLVGEFEEMYQDYEDPWKQSEESQKTDKVIILDYLKKHQPKRVLDIGCGLGFFTNMISENLTADVLGIDISETAINKASRIYPNCNFKQGKLDDFQIYREFKPDVIVMAEITWYVLAELDSL